MNYASHRLADIAELITKGTTPTTLGFEFAETGVPFLRAQNLQDGRVNIDADPLFISLETHKSLARSRIISSDILLSIAGTIGRAALVQNGLPEMNCNQAVAIVRPKETIYPKYLLHWLSSSAAVDQIRKSKVTATISNLSLSQVANLSISLPPLDEQRRIAAILDQADDLRRKRREALKTLNDLPLSAFSHKFGDPITNPKKFPSTLLGDVAKFGSGGTPPKSVGRYWHGSFPWVSPKDMKSLRIHTAEDAISEEVFSATNLRKVPLGTPLIVVRGMILAHTVPIAMAMTELAINQDMKSIHFDEAILPEFGLWCLKAQHNNILAKVASAAHGTKRLDSDVLKQLPVLVPPISEQRSFVSLIDNWSSLLEFCTQQERRLDALFYSLQHRAFRGEL